MFKHVSDEHPDSLPREIKFGMSVVKQHKSSFDRMVFESVLIYRGGHNILNSKSEFSRCQVPRLSVMVGENQQYDKFEKNVEVLKLKRQLVDEQMIKSKSKRRRKFDADNDSSDKEGSGLVNNSNLDGSAVLPNSKDISADNFSHNEAKKENIDPISKFPPKPKPKLSTKKSKARKLLKGQQTISSYFKNSQRALQDFGNSCLSPHPPT